MTNKQLSPEAQAIVNAFDVEYYQKAKNRYDALAAVLRAIVKQSTFADVAVNKTIEVVPVDILLAIANELEGND